MSCDAEIILACAALIGAMTALVWSMRQQVDIAIQKEKLRTIAAKVENGHAIRDVPPAFPAAEPPSD